MNWCGFCGDEFAPVEYNPGSFDEVNYCSPDCEESAQEVDENAEAYLQARYGGAPVN